MATAGTGMEKISDYRKPDVVLEEPAGYADKQNAPRIPVAVFFMFDRETGTVAPLTISEERYYARRLSGL